MYNANFGGGNTHFVEGFRPPIQRQPLILGNPPFLKIPEQSLPSPFSRKIFEKALYFIDEAKKKYISN